MSEFVSNVFKAIRSGLTPTKKPRPTSAEARSDAVRQAEAKRERKAAKSGWIPTSTRASELFTWLETVRARSGVDWRPYVVGLLVERRSGEQPRFQPRSGAESVRLKHCWITGKVSESQYIRVTLPQPIMKAAKELGLPSPSELKSGKVTLSNLVMIAAGRLPANELPGVEGETSHICKQMTVCQRHYKWESKPVNQSRGLDGHVPSLEDCLRLRHNPRCISASPDLADAWVDWSIELLREAMKGRSPKQGNPEIRAMSNQYRSEGRPSLRVDWSRIPAGVPLENLPVLAVHLEMLKANAPGHVSE
jgi:hypothetical protein